MTAIGAVLPAAIAALVPLMLVLIGIGMVVGTPPAGRLADRALRSTLYGVLAGITVASAFLILAVQSKPAAIVGFLFFGLVGAAVIPSSQTRVLEAARGADNLASAANCLGVQHRQRGSSQPSVTRHVHSPPFTDSAFTDSVASVAVRPGRPPTRTVPAIRMDDGMRDAPWPVPLTHIGGRFVPLFHPGAFCRRWFMRHDRWGIHWRVTAHRGMPAG
ncbi:hypothetical protein [Streptomyces sp. NPDC056061]|uniref:hypothetical protein n=1 Tax=Streptomyces sp. NPDC056061 TaxID=3345700 RepID=UPI0035DD94D7